MSRTPARFSQADIARAIRAIAQTGEDMQVEMRPDGVMCIVRHTPLVGSPPKTVEPKTGIVM